MDTISKPRPDGPLVDIVFYDMRKKEWDSYITRQRAVCSFRATAASGPNPAKLAPHLNSLLAKYTLALSVKLSSTVESVQSELWGGSLR